MSVCAAACDLLQCRCPVNTKGTKDTKVKLAMKPNEASHVVIGCALRVHTAVGSGMFESAIDACLFYEFAQAGLQLEHQVRLPLVYRQIRIPVAYRVDFIVENCVIVELKAVEKLLPLHTAQLGDVPPAVEIQRRLG